VVEQALAVGCDAVWLQLGLVSPEAEEMCRAARVPFVQDRCIKMEHCRWFGGLNWVGLSTGVISSRREETRRAG
jgi:predicted CoA-binding protein